MEVYIEKENKTLSVKGNKTGAALLKELKIIPTAVILVKNDAVVLPDEKLSETDKVKILSVVSGG